MKNSLFPSFSASCALALILAILIILAALVTHARSEVTLCRDNPGSGKWIYRIVEGYKCWFEAGDLRRGREKPLSELAWPKYNEPEMIPLDRPPWARPEGWDHKE